MVSFNLNEIVRKPIDDNQDEFNKEIENEFNILHNDSLSDSEKLELLKKSRANQLRLSAVISVIASQDLSIRIRG